MADKFVEPRLKRSEIVRALKATRPQGKMQQIEFAQWLMIVDFFGYSLYKDGFAANLHRKRFSEECQT